MKKLCFQVGCSMLAITGVIASTPALAQPDQATEPAGAAAEDDEAIVITAQRRSERQLDVPISVTSLGAQALETANVQELADIASITPGLRFDFSANFYTPTIRGVGTSVLTSGNASTVGLYVDGFYSANQLATNIQMMNVENIQVLKGPQGTLFGRNTTGGAILIKTADPSTDTSAKFKMSFGRYNEAHAQAYATFGITDRVALDFEAGYQRGDGWQRDLATGGRRVGDYENWSTRLGLKVDLTEDISVLLRWQHSQVNDPRAQTTATYFGPITPGQPPDSGASPLALPGEVTFDRNSHVSDSTPDFFRANNDVFQATIRADLGFANFASYTQYRKEEVDASFELDFTGSDLFQLGLPIDNETVSQEFLLTSKPGGRLQWTGGLFYFSNRDTYLVFIDQLGFGIPEFGIPPILERTRSSGSSSTTKSYAAFADATYEVVDNLFVTAGVRVAYDEIVDAYSTPFLSFPLQNLPTPAVSDAVSGTHVTPRFVLRYKPTDRTSVYLSYAKGYKAAILDLGGGVPAPVRPENLTAYEAGFKYGSGRLQFETSAFYYDYSDLQVSLFQAGTARIVNAAQSKIYGIDAQLSFKVSDSFEINTGANWTHARNKEFDGAPIYVRCNPALIPFVDAEACTTLTPFVLSTDPLLTNLTNTTMQRTPAFSANIGAVYRAPLFGGELTLSGNLFYTSKFFFGPSGVQFPQEGYEVLSLRAQWNDLEDRFFLALWGDNVTDSRYLTQVQYNNSGIGASWSKPVTFGVEFGAKF